MGVCERVETKRTLRTGHAGTHRGFTDALDEFMLVGFGTSAEEARIQQADEDRI